ncbi:E3 ubiquitin-protein ligase-like protein [Drosera capensis]
MPMRRQVKQIRAFYIVLSCRNWWKFMAVSLRESQTDQYPLLREMSDTNVNQEHIIHIDRGGETSTSNSADSELSHGLVSSAHAERPTTSDQAPVSRSSSSSATRTNSRSSSFMRRNEERVRRRWSPFDSGFWISIGILFTLGQIIASVVVLCLSRHEHPRAPLFAWVVGYTAGCFVSVPVMCWRCLHRGRVTDQVSAELSRDSEENSASDPSSYVTISLGQSSETEIHNITSRQNSQTGRVGNPRLNVLADHAKMTLDCFFAVWFVTGNVWIFGGRSSATEAPNLYRLCIVYLTLSCIGYAMPFILCAMMCCCLPCIISFLGIREDQSQIHGASDESINSLPTYKFKAKEKENQDDSLENYTDEESGPGGIIGVGTEKERDISGEDAVCCICLATYMDEDELRELPCCHFFHAECVDRWLRMNASCPLCKSVISESTEEPLDLTNSLQQT